VLKPAKELGDTEPLLRPGVCPLRLELRRAAHLGRVAEHASLPACSVRLAES
jgi:hypothetical protein